MIGAVVGSRPRAVTEQLGRLGLAPVRTVPGGTADETASALGCLAEVLGAAADDVLLVPADLVVHDEALADLAKDPRPRSAALLAASGGEPSVRVRAGVVVDAGSEVHRVEWPGLAATGALRVDRTDAAAAAEAVAEMSDVAARHGWRADPLALAMVALVRRGVPVGAVTLDPWPWARGSDPAADETRRSLAATDAHRVRLARATKADDGFWATFVVRRVSRRLTPVAVGLGWSPNQVTALSFVLGIAAAGCFAGLHAAGGAVGVLGAVLLQLSLVVDCVDGDVARYRRAFTPTGAWLDATTDRVKEFACYAGLAVGAGGATGAWLLAAAMMTLQTARHSLDYTFTAVKDLRETSLTRLPLDRSPGADVHASGSSRAVQASERSNERPAVKWVKRIVHMPIGERWLVLSLGAALGAPRAALAALIAFGLVSLAYTSGGRVLRARAWRAAAAVPDREREIVGAQLDGGPFALAARRMRRLQGVRVPVARFAWALPPALRVAEYGTVLLVVLAVEPDALSAAFALLFVVAYHHYDVLYAVLNRLAPLPVAARVAGLGVDGRLVVVGVLALAGAAALRAGLWSLAGLLGVLFVGYGTARAAREVTARG